MQPAQRTPLKLINKEISKFIAEKAAMDQQIVSSKQHFINAQSSLDESKNLAEGAADKLRSCETNPIASAAFKTCDKAIYSFKQLDLASFADELENIDTGDTSFNLDSLLKQRVRHFSETMQTFQSTINKCIARFSYILTIWDNKTRAAMESRKSDDYQKHYSLYVHAAIDAFLTGMKSFNTCACKFQDTLAAVIKMVPDTEDYESVCEMLAYWQQKQQQALADAVAGDKQAQLALFRSKRTPAASHARGGGNLGVQSGGVVKAGKAKLGK